MHFSPATIFISYAREDTKYKDRLIEHLKVLEHQRVISCWYDSLLEPGVAWGPEIIARLNSSNIILLLVSPSFSNSDFIYGVELRLAFERHRSGTARVIPILVRQLSNWHKLPFGDMALGELGALPDNSKCITRWKPADEAYKNIVDGIEKAVKSSTAPSDHPKGRDVADSAASHIPRPPATGFIRRFGREGRDILQQIKDELSPERNQIVVLSGPGGVGKSTLATEAAREMLSVFDGRVVWIDALSITSFTITALQNEIAARLGHREIQALVPEIKQEEVRRLITNPPALIVIDNFESVAADEQNHCLDFFLKGAFCPVLITTCFAIDRWNICHIPVEPMLLEEAREFIRQVTARTPKRVLPDEMFELILSISHGNPLLIGLVVKQITFGIDPSAALSGLVGGEEWFAHVFNRSFNLTQVGDDGRAVLLALALFVPNASRNALARVAGFGDDLKRLNKAIKKLSAAWLIDTSNEGRRLELRGQTREFARQRLSSHAQEDEFQRSFVAYFIEYGERHRKQRQSTPEEMQALDAERGNLVRAMEIASRMREWVSVVRLMELLHHDVFRGLLPQRGYWEQALRLNELAASAAQELIVHLPEGEERERYIRAKVHFAQNAAYIHQVCGELDEARALYDQALAIAETNKDPDAIAAITHEMGKFEQELGNITKARELYRQSLKIKKSQGDLEGVAITQHELGRLEQDQGNLAEAEALLNQSQDILKEIGEEEDIVSANNLHELGRLMHEQGRIEEARKYYNLSLEIKEHLRDLRGKAITLHEQGRLALDTGEFEEAERLYEESKRIQQDLPDPLGIANTWHELGRLAHKRGRVSAAREYFNKSLAIKKTFGFKRGIAIAYHELGRLALKQDNMRDARRYFVKSLQLQRRLGDKKGLATTLYQTSLLAEAEGKTPRAARRLLKSIRLFSELKSPQLQMAKQRLSELVKPNDL
jgi:tetratricopeptide (TPR) repeat protein